MRPLLFLILFIHTALADFWDDRNTLLSNEASQLFGSFWELTENEQKVNDILMKFKLQEYDEGLSNPSKFLPSIHFFHSKAAIEQSEVFKFIQKVPKGASLHSHSTAMLSTEALLNLTYMEGLYGCDDNTKFKLHFFFGGVNDDCDWRLLEDLRNEDSGFDDFLRSKMTLVVDDPAGTCCDINEVWSAFEDIFEFVAPLFDYRQFLHDYLYQVLREFHDDNVKYLEIRGVFGETFDSNNTIYGPLDTAQLYKETQQEFAIDSQDFAGHRVIYSNSRKVSIDTMDSYISDYLELRAAYPEIVVGFDLVGQEDLGEPLSVFADQLATIANRTKFFFHAGETNWYGTTDLNLIDAILLNTSRIGHAFAITKHPEVLRVVKERNIAIELNPISNQVLKLVDDLRNHVGAYLIANGYPVVITCDGPSFWGAKGLSYDWYMAFMGMTPREGDLRILKELAWNSYVYTALDKEGLPFILNLLQGWWDDFIKEILEAYH
ncbi:adenosine deaminase 2-like [Zophobas morio]|uniref:adenosine deaminase 2-like n=1 Tax=Zophobas morio TaxID=2755281 RepID=UPI003082BB2D